MRKIIALNYRGILHLLCFNLKKQNLVFTILSVSNRVLQCMVFNHDMRGVDTKRENSRNRHLEWQFRHHSGCPPFMRVPGFTLYLHS